MKKLVALAGAVLLLTGCAASSNNNDDKFVSDVESYVGAAPGSLSSQSRKLLIEVAHSICDGLDEGRSTSDVESVVTKLGLDEKFSGKIVSAAISAYCPR